MAVTQAPKTIHLPSGATFEDPLDLLRPFYRDLHPYFDGFVDTAPNQLLPIDVTVTTAINNPLTATKIQVIHRGIAESCSTQLQNIPVDADLLAADFPTLLFALRLIYAALCCSNVRLPCATKILYRKRPHLIPMLDSVVLGYYASRVTPRIPAWKIHQGANNVELRKIAGRVIRAFKRDLLATQTEIADLRALLARDGFALSNVRILESLIWITNESRGAAAHNA